MNPLKPALTEHTIGDRDLTRWYSRPGQWLSRTFGALVDRVRNTEVAVLLLLGVALLLIVGATILAGEIYQAVAAGDGVAQLDEPVLAWAVAARTPTSTAVVAAFSNSGGAFWMSIITGTGVTVLCLLWRRWTPLVLMLIAVSGSLAMTVAGKRIAERVRPPLEYAVPPYETSPSFPSGHTLNATVIGGMFCYLLVSYLTSRVARTVTVVITVLYVLAMGLSRVFLGHHWLTDVLAAWCLGVAWLTVVITGHRLWLTQHRRHSLPVRGQA